MWYKFRHDFVYGLTCAVEANSLEEAYKKSQAADAQWDKEARYDDDLWKTYYTVNEDYDTIEEEENYVEYDPYEIEKKLWKK